MLAPQNEDGNDNGILLFPMNPSEGTTAAHRVKASWRSCATVTAPKVFATVLIIVADVVVAFPVDVVVVAVAVDVVVVDAAAVVVVVDVVDDVVVVVVVVVVLAYCSSYYS